MGVLGTRELKDAALALGFTTVGVCPAVPPPHIDAYRRWLAKDYHGSMSYLATHSELKAHPENLLAGVRSIVAVTLNYNQPNPPAEGAPRIARYALGRDYHKVMRAKLRRLANWITTQYPDEECRSCVDSAPVMERDYAQLAGLGWYGKNTLLIDSRRGSWFFIGLLLTTAHFAPDAPSVGSCGTCTQCVDSCPTGALVFEEGHWQVDARRCISYLTIEHEGGVDLDTSGWTFGCDVCQEVCPFNEPRATQPLRAVQTAEPDFRKRREWPSLEQLRVLGEDEWDTLTQGSPVRRAGLDGLRRNAELNLRQG